MSNKNRLIYILNRYSSSDSSHFYHILNLLEVMAQRGIDIVLVIEKSDGVPKFESSNIEVCILGSTNPIFRSVKLFSVLGKLIGHGYRHTFIRIAAPAAIVAAIAHMLFGGKSYLWQSGTTIEFDKGQPRSLAKIRWYFRSYFPSVVARRMITVFVTGPESMADYYVKVGGVKREKIKVLYNDISLLRFQPDGNDSLLRDNFLSRHKLSSETLILLLVHRLSPVRLTGKYFPACLSILKKSKVPDNVVVVVAGDGEELPELKHQAEKLGVSCQCMFLGGVPNREIEQLYRVADVFLHPTYNEGFSRVVLEAMASGLPIVSTDAGGTRELMGELQAGFVTSKDQPAEFSDTLEKLICDPDLRARLSRENLLRVRRFSTERVAEMYEKVIFE